MLHKMVPIPLGIIGFVFGKCGRNLRAIEEETLIQKLKKNRFLQILINFHDFSKNPILIYFLYLYFQTIMELLLKLTDGELKYGAGLNTSNTELMLPEFEVLKYRFWKNQSL